ncbi:MAG: cell division protein ZapE [Paracoccaceae bacterium]|nr:cell division protein ZapE [Paracoccaceae bacterium]
MAETLIAIYTRLAGEGRLAADPVQEAALPRLEVLREALEAGPRKRFFGRKSEAPRGVYLWGGVGRGKSMLMDLFFASVAIEEKRRVHFHAFMQEVQAGLDAARKDGARDAILPVAEGLMKDLRLLCFDEMQITDIADAMIVGRLFEKLFEAGVSVVATSNRPPGDLYKDGLNRDLFLPFIALLEDKLDIWHLDAETDYRQTKIGTEKTYYYPVDDTARQAARRVWAELGGSPETGGLTLRVKGRDVTLQGFVNGVARSEFYDLCGRPLGPADYLAIAGVCRVMVLEDIPRLSSENYNEARRFVTLIDALYEAGVRLVATAADRPEALYIEGEGTFEFERTASRLREMTSGAFGG